ncbi:hypothetical protein M8818_004821 [Zalaria obscura]|uniref:Uncharacterized protein n=1 Tax=Zalaria obscura TaxID=2024903 RepID=A0ACC3SB21_9PEZI
MAGHTSKPQNIAPAPSNETTYTLADQPVGGGQGTPSEADPARKKRKLTAVACSTCQRRKSDNITSRRTALKQQNAELHDTMGGMNALIDRLKVASDSDASKVLARIRVGENVDDIIREIQDEGTTHVQVQPQSPEPEGPEPPSFDLGLSDVIRKSPQQELFAPLFPDHEELDPASFNLIDIPGTLERYMSRADDIPLWPDTPVDCSPLFDRMTWSAWMPKGAAAGEYDQSGSELGPLRPGSSLENPTSIRSSDAGIGDWQTSSQSNIGPPYSAVLPHYKNNFESQAESFRRRLSAAEPTHQEGVSVAPGAHDSAGNLPLSDPVQSAIRPTRGPSSDAGIMLIPHWAMMSVSQDEDGTPTRALNTFYVNTLHAIRAGAPIAQIIGPHPFIAALSDREKFAMAPELSKWAARMVRSIKSTAGAGGSIADQTKTDVTHCALMYLFWLVMRWMLHPCADHYYAIPCWLRPTPEQLCNPHPMVMDFLVWPKIRELRGEALRDLGWLLQVCMTMTVNWPEERGGGLKGAVCIDGQSGELDLNPIAKDRLYNLENWSVAPSVRRYLPNADEMLKVRAEE